MEGGNVHVDGRVISLQPADALPLVLAGANHVVRKHPLKLTSYVVGLLLAIAGSGFAVTRTQQAAFEAAMPEDGLVRKYDGLQGRTDAAHAAYYHSKGWFSCDARCMGHYDTYMTAKRASDAQAAVINEQLRRAHGILGVFSAPAVQRARDLYWQLFNGGVAFAKRQTMWDAFFVGMRAMGRDEGMLSYALNMLLVFLSNFITSVFVSTLYFCYRVRDVITFYNAGWVAGIAFWLAAVTAALSVVLTVIVGATAAVGGTVVGVAMLASAGATRRLNAGAGGPQARMHYQ